MKIELGKNIKEERIKKQLIQQELADHLNISRQTISKWELDKSYPDLELLVQMSKLFEVSVDHLLASKTLLKNKNVRFLISFSKPIRKESMSLPPRSEIK